jgi:hypothetical protein
MDLLLPGIAAVVTLAAFWAGRRICVFPIVCNFEGRRIPVAGSSVALGIMAACMVAGEEPAALAVAAFAFFGALDDAYGDRSASGFRGHIRAALHGKITTGFLKMIGGGLVALVCGYLLRDAGWYAAGSWWLAKAAVIALGANAVNLLDTRPVRAIFGFWCLIALAAPFGGLSPAGLGATLVWAPFDRRRFAMLGDAGSNALGAFWGVIFVSAAPAWAILMALAALVAFHVYTERRSLNADINRVPWLRRLDEIVRGQ